MPEYVARQGDCISSIAEEFGFRWETIWDHPRNAALKARRGNPNVLLPGDSVFVPELRVEEAGAATDRLHRFVRSGVPAKVRLRLLDFERKPRAHLRYTASLDGRQSQGVSDAGGYVEISAPPNAKHLDLTVYDGARTGRYSIVLGHVDPIQELSGVQQRLTNLGFPCLGAGQEETSSALRAFQQQLELPATGESDDATRDRLLSLHGC